MTDMNMPLPLKGTLDLSPWLMNIVNDIHYDAESREVWRMVHFHAEDQSVWGYTRTVIPGHITTLGALLDYMVGQEEDVFRRPAPVTELPTPCLRLVWRNRKEEICRNGDRISVGRSGCDLSFPDEAWRGYLSRTHACFVYRDDTWYLEDQFPKNTIRINQVPVIPGSVTALKPGDVIRLTASAEELIFDPPAP